MQIKYLKSWMVLTIFFLIFAATTIAQEEKFNFKESIGISFLWIAIILLAAKISSLIERFGQTSVLGELAIGVVMGNLALIGISIFEPIKTNLIISFLGQLGVVILLFQIGLESSIQEMRKVGLRAFIVAVVGVVVPFALATMLVGPLLLPNLPFNSYLFLGAILTATSVSITARVFKDAGVLNSPEAKIVLGAAVIDDVLGLIILAVVSGIVTSGAISFGSVSWITFKAILFLVLSIWLGALLAPVIGKFFSKIHTGIGMKLTIALSFCLIFSYLAEYIGLAPIVGAFAAGLVLTPVHFKYFKDSEIINDIKLHINKFDKEQKDKLLNVVNRHSDRHIQVLLEPISFFLVPIFFIITGISVNLSVLFQLKILLLALAISAVAIFGKVVTGLVAGKVKKSIVGWGMVPRGEVGLIFATMGKSIGVINDEIYSVIVIVILITTLVTPPILSHLLKKK